MHATLATNYQNYPVFFSFSQNAWDNGEQRGAVNFLTNYEYYNIQNYFVERPAVQNFFSFLLNRKMVRWLAY